MKLRFKSNHGLINSEDLWDLSLENLDVLAQSLEAEVKTSKKKSFITKRSKADATAKLRFALVKHVIDVKLDEREAAANAAETKAYNQKILEKIEAVEDRELDEMSAKDLRKLLK